MHIYTGYKLVRQFSLPAETVCHIWLPSRLSGITCFLPRLLPREKKLPAETVRVNVLPAENLVRKQNQPDTVGSKLFITHSSLVRKQNHAHTFGSKLFITAQQSRQEQESRTVPAEDKYDGQSRREPKTGGLVYFLCFTSFANALH